MLRAGKLAIVTLAALAMAVPTARAATTHVVTPGVAPPLPLRVVADEAEFEEELDTIDRLMKGKRWSQAADALDELLAEHEGESHVLVRLPRIKEIARRCDFWSTHDEPEAGDLVSGEILSYKRQNGQIKVRYVREDRAPTAEDAEDEDGSDFFSKMLAELLGTSDDQISKGDFQFNFVGGVPVHPLHFSGPYTVEIKGRMPEDERDQDYLKNIFSAPRVVVGIDDGHYYRVNFAAPKLRGLYGPVQLTAGSMMRWEGQKRQTLDEEEKTLFKAGKRYTIKVAVTAKKITASVNGKSYLSGKWKSDGYGQFGFSFCPGVTELNISGQANTSWLEGLVDARTQEMWDEYDEQADVNALLPEWLRTSGGGAVAATDGETDADGGEIETVAKVSSTKRRQDEYPGKWHPGHAKALDQLDAFVEEREYDEAMTWLDELAEKKGRSTAVFITYERAVLHAYRDEADEALALLDDVREADPAFPDARVLQARLLFDVGRAEDGLSELRAFAEEAPTATAFDALANHLLLLGRPEEAREIVDGAIRSGVSPAELEQTHTMLTRAVSGPSWLERHEAKSKNYVVASDHSRKLCSEASQILEQSLAMYQRLLGRADVDERRVFQVFLFSGSAGYQNYAEDLFGTKAENTAGLYSPNLKQLLVWNLPSRDDMFGTVRHEGFHQYLDGLLSQPPVWFNEGSAEYFEAAEQVRGRMNPGGVHNHHVTLLTSSKTEWTPLDELIRLGRGDFYAKPSLHYAQSWALIHYLQSAGREEQALYQDYFEALLGGANRDDAAEMVFGSQDLRRLEKDVKKHMRDLKRKR